MTDSERAPGPGAIETGLDREPFGEDSFWTISDLDLVGLGGLFARVAGAGLLYRDETACGFGDCALDVGADGADEASEAGLLSCSK